MESIKEDVLNVIANSTVDKNKLFLPNEQLERSLYLNVNKVLISLGGKWSRSVKAHIFDKDVEEIIEQLLLTGKYTNEKKEYQFFETPLGLANKMVKMANISLGDTVLEPSAGRGKIASLVKHCDCCELNAENRKYLEDNGFRLVGDDFLKCEKQYDVIIANPPFSRQQDIDHITHMIHLARKTVVSVASYSVLFRTNKKTVIFRELIDEFNGTIERLPENTFVESGTKVNTCIIFVNKGAKP